MNRRALLLLTAASAVVLSQSCRRTDVTKTNSGSTGASNGLKIDNVGDYKNFQVINRYYNGESAQIAGLSLTNGGTGNLAAWNNSAHQKWRITNVANGEYTIMNLGSGKFVQAYNYQGNTIAIQNSADNADDQKWIISLVPNGYKIVSKTSGLALSGNGDYLIQLLPFVAGNTKQVWGANPVNPTGYRDDQVVNFFHRVLPTQGSIAFDQGSSIGMSDGRVLWVTEDAFDGTRVTADGNLMCGFFQYHNSILIQPANHDWNPNNTPNMTISGSTSGQPRQICNTQPNTDVSWPGVGVEVGNTVYMYNAEISFSNSITTQVIYELSEQPTSAANLWPVKRTLIHGVSDQSDIGWQAGMCKADDGYIYVFGIKGVFFSNNVFVARFAPSDPHTYYFWNGTTWSTTPITSSNNAAVILNAQTNVAFSYAKGHFIMLQADLGYFCDPSSHDLYLSTATSPTGPFTKAVDVFTIQDMYRGHLNRYYTPMIHPEFDNGKDELLVTYSVNFGSGCAGVGDDNCVNNEQPSINYQVKGVRVPYSVIGL